MRRTLFALVLTALAAPATASAQTDVMATVNRLSRLVILEFPTKAQAREWWNSPEYAPVKAMRQKSAQTDMLLIDGQTSLA